MAGFLAGAAAFFTVGFFAAGFLAAGFFVVAILGSPILGLHLNRFRKHSSESRQDRLSYCLISGIRDAS
jgi:hypothetical protein